MLGSWDRMSDLRFGVWQIVFSAWELDVSGSRQRGSSAFVQPSSSCVSAATTQRGSAEHMVKAFPLGFGHSGFMCPRRALPIAERLASPLLQLQKLTP